MIEESARVVAIDDDAVWIEARRQSACGRCGIRSGCGHGLMDELRRGPSVHLRLPLAEGSEALAAGDQVVVGIEESALLRASFRVYGLPLLGFLLGAAVGDAVAGTDAGAAVGGGLGMVVGFISTRALRKEDGIEVPRILRRVDAVPVQHDGPRPISIV